MTAPSKKKLFANLVLLIPVFAAILFSIPGKSFAATMTKTTVTVKVEKVVISTRRLGVGDLSIGIRRGNLYYEGFSYSGTVGSFLIYKKDVARCSSSRVEDSQWKISVSAPNASFTSPYTEGIDNQSICGNPTFTFYNRTLLGMRAPAKSGGGTCATCPVTATPPASATKTITGTLKRITGQGIPAEDKIYYIDTTAANDTSLSLGTSASKWTWDPTNTYTAGSTYACNYQGSLAVPTSVSCKAGTTPPANNNSTPSGAASGASSGSTTTPTGELAIKTGTGNIITPTLDETKCPSDSTTNAEGQRVYTKGILKGVPCDGAINSLDEVLGVVKNVVSGFLLPIVGVLFIIMLLIGGILYITSRGNQTQIDRAKKTLTAAIIGLLIVTLSYTLIAIFANLIGGGIA